MPYYWRLSGFYLFYFASVGALYPFWGLYLKDHGFSAVEIGQMMAVIMATKIVSPNIWGWIADHTGKRMAIVRLGTLLSVLSFALVLVDSSYLWLMLVMVVFSFFWNAALPQFEATTMNHLGEQVHRYSAIRLWGSIGFILAVAILGALLERFGTDLLPWVILAVMLGIWLFSLSVPERAAGHLELVHEPFIDVLRQPKVIALLLICFLVQVSHGPYYTFYSIYLEEFDYQRTVIGGLWALGVIAEVVVFLFMHRLVSNYSLRFLMLASLILTTLRWLLIGFFVSSPTVLLLAQLFHAASFGIYHAVAIHLIHRYFQGRHQGRGQALYSSVSFGAGGAIGAYYSGLTWEVLGSAASFAIAAGASLLAFIIAWYWGLPKESRAYKDGGHS